MKDIFKSKFTLKFKNEKIEKEYQEIREKNYKLWNIVYSIIMILLSITNNILFGIDRPKKKDLELWFYIEILSYILTGIGFIKLIICIFTKNIIVQKSVSFINFITILLNDINLRSYLSIFIQVEYSVYSLIYTLIKLFILIWFFTNTLDFIEGFYLFIIISLLNYGMSGAFIPLKLHVRYAVTAIINAMICLMSYLYVYEKRKSFYYNYTNQTSLKWHNSVIDNINSGFISIVKNKINYINKSLLNILMKDKTREIIASGINLNGDERRNIINEKSLICDISNNNLILLMNELFENVNFKENILEGVETQNNYELAINYIKRFKEEENFKFIFHKSISTSNNSLYYEIFGRYYILDGGEECFEFIFNDVTKVKIEEEINADYKYKKVFLSKVAHEFKNPIICITELINQIFDIARNSLLRENHEQIILQRNLNNNFFAQIKEILKQIKYTSDYLLILVKDMDFFSSSFPGSISNLKLEKEMVKLKEILLFCKNITNTLIKKYLKEQSLIFKLECDNNLPEEIYTDETRLKQLLINLLSNSVKYTSHGSITLKVNSVQDNIRFEVEDTGKGLSEAQQIMLKTGNDNFKITKLGSGLGLSVVRDILELFGSHLEYEISQNQGSKFSFSINKGNYQNSEDLQNNMPFQHNEECMDLNELNSSKNSCLSCSTVPRAFIPSKIKENPQYISLQESKIVPKSSSLFNEDNISKIEVKKGINYIFVVDDETTIRKSAIRLLNIYFETMKNLNFSIIEAADGIECLYSYYQFHKKGVSPSFIISDETMNYMNGSVCAKILKDINTSRGFKNVPFFMLTAYEDFYKGEQNGIVKAYTKPMSKKHIVDIFNTIGLN